MFGFWKKQKDSDTEAKKVETVEKAESKKKEVTKEELKEIIRIISADPTVFCLPHLQPELCKSAPDLLEERSELKRLLSDSRFKVFSHVASAYKEKIKEIDIKLDHLKKIAHLITSGYPPTLEYLKKYGGFIKDPGRVMESPVDWALGYKKGMARIHYHGVFFKPIPKWVLDKYQNAKSFFNVCFAFSKQRDDFLGIVDQKTSRIGEHSWEDVKTSDWFQEQIKKRIQNISYADEEISIVGFLPLKAGEKLDYKFSFPGGGIYSWSSKVEIIKGIGFHIVSWNPKEEMEKNTKGIFVAKSAAL